MAGQKGWILDSDAKAYFEEKEKQYQKSHQRENPSAKEKTAFAKGTADLHVHRKNMEGVDATEAVLNGLKDADIKTFALTDSDPFIGSKLADVLPEDVRCINGVSFSCFTDFGEINLLGYGFDPEAPAMARAVAAGRDLRAQKLETQLSYLKFHHGIVFTEEQLAMLSQLDAESKPLLAKLMVQNGVVKDADEALMGYINGINAGDSLISARMVVDAVRDAGGVVVWGHPLGMDPSKKLNDEDFSRQLQFLLSYGVMGMECYYSTYGAKDAGYLINQAEAYRMLISGGSDYYPGAVGNRPGKLSLEDAPVFSENLSLLGHLEG